MKATGIVRKLDELGRIVIPVELRRSMGLGEKDPVEIYVDKEKIILKKHVEAKVCMITGVASGDNKSFFDGKIVLSAEGIEMLSKQLK
jgi:transcriptional pleiotropic regulator of transition state genes